MGLPLLFIVVRSEFQRKRIGDKLMSQLLEIARGKYSFLLLTVAKENKPAISLFQKYGFATCAGSGGTYFMLLHSAEPKILKPIVGSLYKVYAFFTNQKSRRTKNDP